jgi:ABC-type polysaccharide/polyol phosphate export permease
MGACALYAASAVGVVRRPPFQRLGLAVMATVCLVRALLLPVLTVRHPELRNTFEIVAVVVWFLAGIGFVVGFRIAKTELNHSLKWTAAEGLR